LTRPLDKHLDPDELDALVSSRGITITQAGGLLEQELKEAERHVASCHDCSLKLKLLRSMHNDLSSPKPLPPVPPGPQCLDEAEWRSVAAGLLSTPETRERMIHASQCGHCGPLLKQAAEALAVEVTRREEALLSSLRSVQPDWQSRMAQALSTASQPVHSVKQLSVMPGAWRLPLLALAALACVAVATWVGMRLLRGPSVDRLLAQAYTQRRTLEVRIPDAQYAPLRVERGGSVSNLDKPPSLLKAEALIGEKLQSHPNDPVWLDARARADLLDGNYDSAAKTLQHALLAQPDSARLWTDLGSAYYMRGQSAENALDYGQAIEALGKALVKEPDDLIALFNRALACEQLFLYDRAAVDWGHYLHQDPQGEWAKEAREHLDRVRQNLEKRQQRHTQSLLSPRDFPLFGASANARVVASIDARPETYQDVALRSWLPTTLDAHQSSQDARRALETLAAILRNNHDDTWLQGFLEGPSSAAQSAAIRELLASETAVQTGHYGHGIELAQQSMKDFAHARNQAGMLRAALAIMAAQDFALKYTDCLRTAAASLPLLAKTQYRWLQAATLIERGECLAGTAALQEAIKSNRRGWELANHAHYRELALRATSFGASYLLNTGSAEQGLRELRSGLATFWQSDVSDMPGENLYSCLFEASDGTNWPFVDAFALEELLQQFPSSDPIDRAVERESLAGAQERAGDDRAARETLRSAAAHLNSLPSDRDVTLREAEIAVKGAQIQIRLGDAQGAIAFLAPFRQAVETASPGRFQAQYFKTFGEAYLRLGKEAEAQPLLERALAVRETGLRNLLQEADKLAWSRGEDELYRDLLEVALKLKTPAEAWALWESYKGASLRPSAGTASSFMTRDVSVLAPAHDTALVSYALLKASIIVFVLRDREIHVHTLALPPELQQLVPRFLSLCSDPTTDTNLIDNDGRQLYRVLVAPLESDLGGARALRIETDGILDQIPFNLLRGPDSNYLADRFEVAFSQGTSYASRTPPEAISPGSAALVVVASADSSLAALPGADQEGTEVAGLFRKAVLISGRGITRGEVLAQLRDAQLFHFAGHAFAGADRSGLVMGPESLLSAHDIAALPLRNLRLAVLSACDTANGDEGTPSDLNSVARTLVAAGVPNVVASRWRVDSATTRQLMRDFYSSLVSGKSPAAALRAAEDTVRNVPRYRHPYYWASFAVFGTS
jgi:CHAT domain-containing protein/tetratricopeptide (TPR) repeat protein